MFAYLGIQQPVHTAHCLSARWGKSVPHTMHGTLVVDRDATEGTDLPLLNGDDPVAVHASARGARPSAFVVKLTLFSVLGGLLFGYDSGVISGALLKIKDDFDLNSTQLELVVSATVGMAIVGAAVAGTLSDRLGRRPVILLSSVVFTVGALVMALARTYELLVVGRGIVGVGIGISSMVIPCTCGC